MIFLSPYYPAVQKSILELRERELSYCVRVPSHGVVCYWRESSLLWPSDLVIELTGTGTNRELCITLGIESVVPLYIKNSEFRLSDVLLNNSAATT